MAHIIAPIVDDVIRIPKLNSTATMTCTAKKLMCEMRDVDDTSDYPLPSPF